MKNFPGYFLVLLAILTTTLTSSKASQDLAAMDPENESVMTLTKLIFDLNQQQSALHQKSLKAQAQNISSNADLTKNSTENVNGTGGQMQSPYPVSYVLVPVSALNGSFPGANVALQTATMPAATSAGERNFQTDGSKGALPYTQVYMPGGQSNSIFYPMQQQMPYMYGQRPNPYGWSPYQNQMYANPTAATTTTTTTAKSKGKSKKRKHSKERSCIACCRDAEYLDDCGSCNCAKYEPDYDLDTDASSHHDHHHRPPAATQAPFDFGSVAAAIAKAQKIINLIRVEESASGQNMTDTKGNQTALELGALGAGSIRVDSILPSSNVTGNWSQHLTSAYGNNMPHPNANAYRNYQRPFPHPNPYMRPHFGRRPGYSHPQGNGYRRQPFPTPVQYSRNTLPASRSYALPPRPLLPHKS